ncbi:RING-H2 finger protein ATL78-like [Gastrolobium bilobum]|uniref:RING-H2 finger protein ATL78-like n=1 Tax=Gastrolobium bilobum TaxID=150636 RepID=UPI002AB29900|nr:RING-H2 finger protein ATL78-like [Gastrolobium bilobum]
MAETHSQAPTPTLGPFISIQQQHEEQGKGLDWMVLVAAIICAFLCALGLNTMLQCVFQCASRVLTEPLQWFASRRLNSGLKRKEMVALPTSTYSNTSGSTSSPSNCVICLAEFSIGDQIRFLPNCNHHFHVVCIDKWLLSHSSCPTCRHLLKSSDSAHSLLIAIAQ